MAIQGQHIHKKIIICNVNRKNMMRDLRGLASNRALKKKYNKIYDDNRLKIQNGDVFTVPLAKKNPGISLLVGIEGALGANTINKIRSIQDQLKEVEPTLVLADLSQLHHAFFLLNPSYCCDMIDMKHSTVKNIVSMGSETYTGPSVFQERYYYRYLEVINDTLRNMDPFQIKITGITASTKAVIAQGFDGGKMNTLRIKLWNAFFKANLAVADRQPNIVHFSLVRYNPPMKNPAKFVELLDRFRDVDLGELRIDKFFMIREILSYLEKYELTHTFSL